MPHPCTHITYDRYIIVMYVYYSTLDEFSGKIPKQSVKNSCGSSANLTSVKVFHIGSIQYQNSIQGGGFDQSKFIPRTT